MLFFSGRFIDPLPYVPQNSTFNPDVVPVGVGLLKQVSCDTILLAHVSTSWIAVPRNCADYFVIFFVIET